MKAALFVVVVALSLGLVAAPAGAEPVEGPQYPEFNGLANFPTIKGPTEPDEFTWQVRLGEDQELLLASETEAWVMYDDGANSFKSFAITAEGARDLSGAYVPTTLRVAEGGILTFVVHDREGNVAAGGAPFAYPIVPARSWAPSDVHPIEVVGPPDEMEIEAERIAAQRAKEAQQAEAPGTTPAPACRVPSVHGLRLAAAKAKLRADHCAIGQVRLAHGATTGKSKVVKQFKPAGTQLTAGTPVAVKLG
jgi:PASTA domain-containing protein